MTSNELVPLIERLPYEEKIKVIKIILDRLALHIAFTQSPKPQNQRDLLSHAGGIIEMWSQIECAAVDQQRLSDMLKTEPLADWEIDAMQNKNRNNNLVTINVI